MKPSGNYVVPVFCIYILPQAVLMCKEKIFLVCAENMYE